MTRTVGPRVVSQLPRAGEQLPARPPASAAAPKARGPADSFAPVPPPPPAALGALVPLSGQDLQGMVDSLGVSATARTDVTFLDLPRGSLSAKAGTRLTASVSDYCLYLHASPPLKICSFITSHRWRT